MTPHAHQRNTRMYLLRLCDGIAAVVGEARYVAFISGVHDLVCAESHEVVMLVPVVAHSASLELQLVQHLAHVLDDELTSEESKE